MPILQLVVSSSTNFQLRFSNWNKSEPCKKQFVSSGSIFIRRIHWSHRVGFTVGEREVKSFRMIERHYFRDQLIKSFDFDFGFCVPKSRNSIEHIYDMPEFDSKQSKFHTKSFSSVLNQRHNIWFIFIFSSSQRNDWASEWNEVRQFLFCWQSVNYA